MKNGICPKCAGAAVYELKPRGKDRRVIIAPLTWLEPTLYVCQACGYSETYFLDSVDHSKLPAYGRRVKPAS